MSGSKRLRLGVVLPTLTAGGVLRKVSYMQRMMSEAWEIIIINMYGPPTVWGSEADNRVCNLHLSFPGTSDREIIDHLVSVFLSLRLDIVHSMHVYTDIFAIPAANRAGALLTLRTVHGITQVTSRNGFQRSDIRLDWDDVQISQQLAVEAGCDATFCVSHDLTSRLLTYGFDGKKLITLHNGVDTQHFALASVPRTEVLAGRRTLGPDDGRIVIAVSGRLDLCKNPFAALELYSNSAKLRENSVLCYIGGGPLETSLKCRIAQMGLDRHVRVLGERPFGEMRGLLANTDLLTLFSSTEGFPFAILEAMAMEVPVVATPVGGISEIITDGVDGFLGFPTEPRTKVALEMLVRRKDLRTEIGQLAARKVVACFDVRERIQAELFHYSRLLRGKRCSH